MCEAGEEADKDNRVDVEDGLRHGGGLGVAPLDKVGGSRGSNAHQELRDLRAGDELLDDHLHREANLQGRQRVISIHDGMITNEAVAQSFGKPYVNPDQLINADQFL